jgi:heat-inducible transcriptional repressor
MPNTPVELSERQREILSRVVEDYVESGQPIGSKRLLERSNLGVSPSTVRGDLAELELRGLLTHPHTSAGRVPTEDGYRHYAESLLDRLEPRPTGFALDLSGVRSEVESALRATTEMLSGVTRLLALVSAPPLETTTVRHVELLQLQPQVGVVVVITSTGGVTKRIFTTGAPIDPGLASWAREYLAERVAGLQLGSHQLKLRLEEPGLSAVEREFLERIRPAFTDAAAVDEQRLYVGGAAGLLDEVRGEELEACRRLLRALEERAALLQMLGEALDPHRPFVRVGGDLPAGLRDVAAVGAGYGLAHRTLGAVSLLGPVRMDYDKAIRSVRAAAQELSRFVEDVYDEN